MKTVGNCRNPKFLNGGKNQADSNNTKHKIDVEKAKMAISSGKENQNRRELERREELTRPPSLSEDITPVLGMCILGRGSFSCDCTIDSSRGRAASLLLAQRINEDGVLYLGRFVVTVEIKKGQIRWPKLGLISRNKSPVLQPAKLVRQTAEEKGPTGERQVRRGSERSD
ncbi:hypothetical protein SLEP1_g15778 [Rubroshorea leprosula]|uniref:Uncharacterized protein n=1 Tax=Rubroshorea leprosula TaxID=152421 RepID=A0AAV5J077_9ROSI|nr:hypothetical protein SLEP1_g15778 [Rubroshorea leprosula]